MEMSEVAVREVEVESKVEGPSSEVSAVASSGACLRFSDLSWARRDLRSLAAAASFSWEDMSPLGAFLLLLH